MFHFQGNGIKQGMQRLRIGPKFSRLRLNGFSRHSVQQFHNGLRESGLAPATCDHHLKLIRQALNLAVDWDLIESNPVAKLKLFHVDNREERLMSLSLAKCSFFNYIRQLALAAFTDGYYSRTA